MEKKEEKQKDNRFTYSSDEGLKVLSEKDILDSIGKESDKKEVNKSQTEEEIKIETINKNFIYKNLLSDRSKKEEISILNVKLPNELRDALIDVDIYDEIGSIEVEKIKAKVVFVMCHKTIKSVNSILDRWD
jgi:hypothetical protein